MCSAATRGDSVAQSTLRPVVAAASGRPGTARPSSVRGVVWVLILVREPSCGWILSVSGSGVELGELMEQQRVAFPDEDTPHIITVLSTALLRAGMAWPGHTVSRPH